MSGSPCTPHFKIKLEKRYWYLCRWRLKRYLSNAAGFKKQISGTLVSCLHRAKIQVLWIELTLQSTAGGNSQTNKTYPRHVSETKVCFESFQNPVIRNNVLIQYPANESCWVPTLFPWKYLHFIISNLQVAHFCNCSSNMGPVRALQLLKKKGGNLR